MQTTVEALNPTAVGTLKIAPSDGSTVVPVVSFAAGKVAGNSEIVRIGSTGKLTVTNTSDSPVDAFVSVEGYYLADGTSVASGKVYTPLPAEEHLYDTELGKGGAIAGNKIGAWSSASFGVAGSAGVPSSGAAAVAVNITVKNQTADGWVSAYPLLTFDPSISSVDYSATGGNTSGFQIVPLNSNGMMVLTNHGSGSVHFTVTVRGYFTAPESTNDNYHESFEPVASQVVTNTQTGLGVTGGSTAPLAAGASLAVDTTQLSLHEPDEVSAVALSMTTSSPTANGYLAVHPTDVGTDSGMPSVSFSQNGTATSGFDLVAPDPNGSVTITNHSTGTVHLRVAVKGYYSQADAHASESVNESEPVVTAQGAEDVTAGDGTVTTMAYSDYTKTATSILGYLRITYRKYSDGKFRLRWIEGHNQSSRSRSVPYMYFAWRKQGGKPTHYYTSGSVWDMSINDNPIPNNYVPSGSYVKWSASTTTNGVPVTRRVYITLK